MVAQPKQTLRDRGFVLPTVPPKIGHARFDGKPQWNCYALKLVVRDFLEPTEAGQPIVGRNRGERTDALINAEAERDGHDYGPHGYTMMARDFTSAYAERRAAERVAAWLGYSVHEIWPHRFGLKLVDTAPGAPGRRINKLPLTARMRTAWTVLVSGRL